MSKTIAFDTETRGLDWFNPEQQAFLASYADADGEYVADLSKPDDVQCFVNALESADTLVCHNLSFDVHMVRASVGFDACANGHTLHDTDLISRVIHPSGPTRASHRLKDLAQTYLSADAKAPEEHIKEMGKSIGLRTLKQNNAYYEVWRAYPDVMEKYAKMDARYTFDLYMQWKDEAAGTVYDLEQQVAPILIEAERQGVAIDQLAVERLQAQYAPEEERLREKLIAELGDVIEGEGSRDGLRDALVEHGIPLRRKTDTGILRTDHYALQEFEDEYPVIADLMEWRRCKRFLDTYLAPMAAADPALHTSHMQCEAWTGRMSSRRPNLQNLPSSAGSEIRSPIVPRPGHSFVVCDYEGIEARELAYYMNDETYKQFFRDGQDPHAWMAAQIHGGEPADFAKGGPNADKRATAKNTMFAITYGAGAPRVSDMNKISKDEAKALISKIKSSLPNYRQLTSRIRRKVEAEGHVTTVLGRKQLVKRDKAYVGLNALIQGSAADIFKQGVVNAAEALKPYGGTPLLFIHDEIVAEVPTECADQALHYMKLAMESAYDLDPPLTVEGAVVHNNYSEAK